MPGTTGEQSSPPTLLKKYLHPENSAVRSTKANCNYYRTSFLPSGYSLVILITIEFTRLRIMYLLIRKIITSGPARNSHPRWEYSEKQLLYPIGMQIPGMADYKRMPKM